MQLESESATTHVGARNIKAEKGVHLLLLLLLLFDKA